MLGDAVVQMPSDLRPTAAFELDSPTQPTYRPKGITRLTVDIPSSYNPERRAEKHPEPRWRTSEFIAYYVVFVVAIPLMVWIPNRLSTREYCCFWVKDYVVTQRVASHPNYPFYESSLSPGWLFGRQVVSDLCIFTRDSKGPAIEK